MTDWTSLDLPTLHRTVRERIAAGDPGLAQLGTGFSTVSLIMEGDHIEVFGLPDDIGSSGTATVENLLNAVMDDLTDHHSLASRQGIISRQDLEGRADWWLHRWVFGPTQTDKEMARKLLALAATWPG